MMVSRNGMMAVFGAPEALARKEQQAVEAARRIVDSMPPTLAVGVGVATGDAFVGSIRSTDRLIWSAVGSTTNLASRLQSMTRELSTSIAIDETTRKRAGYVCADFVRHADVAIRGRTGRFEVFALPLKEGGLEDATSRAPRESRRARAIDDDDARARRPDRCGGAASP
jgi:adenylate cyclase